MDQSQASSGLSLPLDIWLIRPSRIAALYYFTLYFFILLLFSMLGYYQQRGLLELLIAFLLVLLIARRDRKVYLQSRKALQLRYDNNSWVLFEELSKHDSNSQMKSVARSARVRVLLISPICLVMEGEQEAQKPRNKFKGEVKQSGVLPRMIIWRDQLSYHSWRMLQSRLAAQ